MSKIKNIILALFVAGFMPAFSACSNSTLGTPQNLKLDDATYSLTWNAVDNADYYGVEINGKVYQTKSNNFSLASFVAESGVYQIRVAAYSQKTGLKNSEFTNFVTINKRSQLAAPKLEFNESSGDLSWGDVPGAYYYNLNINGVNLLTTQTNFNIYDGAGLENYLIRGKVNKFFVYCPSTSSYDASANSKEVSIFIASLQNTPTNLKVEQLNGVWTLSFDRISTSNTYIINVNDKTFEAQSNVVDISMLVKGFGKYYVSVIAAASYDRNGNLAYMQSKTSEVLEFESKPSFTESKVENLTLNQDKVLSYTGFDDAAEYNVKILDNLQAEVATLKTKSCTINLSNYLTGPMLYEIVVVAKNGEYESLPQSITYKNVVDLQPPQAVIAEPETSREEKRHLTITADYSQIATPVAFEISFANNLLETFETSNIDISSYLQLGENQISITAVCDNEFYNNSSTQTITYNYYVMEMPTNLTIDSDNVLSFSKVQSQTATYKVYIKSFRDESQDAVIETPENSVDISAYIVNAGKYEIGVSSLDAGIESGIATISHIVVQTLSVPQNVLAVQQNDGKVYLSFDSVSNAVCYAVFVDGTMKTQVQTTESIDITSYCNIGSQTKINVQAVGNEEVYLSSNLSGDYNFTYIYQLESANVDVVADHGKYYLVIDNNENVNEYVANVNGNKITVTQTDFDTNSNSYKIDIDSQITQNGDYMVEVSPVVDQTYYNVRATSVTKCLKTYSINEYQSTKFFYNGKDYTYAVNSYFELGEAVLHAMLYRLDSIEVYLNFEYSGIDAAFDSEESLIQKELPLINNYDVDLAKDGIGALVGIFLNANIDKSAALGLIERVHDSMYLYITGTSKLTSQKSDRVYTITFNYSNAGKYQADESHLTGAEPNYLGKLTSKTFPIDSKTSVPVETMAQLMMAVQFGRKPNFVNQDDPSLNHIAENTYNSARYILSQICTDSMTDYEVVKTIHDWIVLNNTYDYTTFDAATGAPFSNQNLSDMAFFASGTILKNLSVCSGYAQTFTLMCSIMGIEGRVCFGLIANGVDWRTINFDNILSLFPLLSANVGAHSWNRVYISTPTTAQKAWYIVDPTWDDYDNGQVSYNFFMKRDEDIASTRKEFYPNGDYYKETDLNGQEINFAATTIFNM